MAVTQGTAAFLLRSGSSPPSEPLRQPAVSIYLIPIHIPSAHVNNRVETTHSESAGRKKIAVCNDRKTCRCPFLQCVCNCKHSKAEDQHLLSKWGIIRHIACSLSVLCPLTSPMYMTSKKAKMATPKCLFNDPKPVLHATACPPPRLPKSIGVSPIPPLRFSFS